MPKEPMSYTKRTRRKQRTPQKDQSQFMKKEITWDDTPLFFPQGYEKIFLALYFITIPYFTGVLFLFFYIAKADKKAFLAISSDNNFFYTWAIGYEIIAVFIFLWIVKSAIDFTLKKKNTKRRFQRP